MGIVQAVLFFVTSFGFVAIGLGSLVGPLFIPFYMWPTQAGKFYRWLDFMIVYSFYQVVATAFVYVWTNVIVYFFRSRDSWRLRAGAPADPDRPVPGAERHLCHFDVQSSRDRRRVVRRNGVDRSADCELDQ